jgi:hypothetical protein
MGEEDIMGLGTRNARGHDTEQMRRLAVIAEDYADFRQGQRVMTCDGFPGTVAAVEDGPYPGTEAYRVELDGNLGGGLYTTGQLQALPGHVAGEHHSAADDYPELGSILDERPDIAKG